MTGRGDVDSGNLRSGGGEEIGEQRERGMGLTTSGCLLYARHHARHCMYFMCANTLDSTKIWRDEY